MKQGLLAFQYEQEKSSTGMTALSGLMTYLELMQAAALRSSVERHVRLRERGQGWTDSQMIISLMLLNLAGARAALSVGYQPLVFLTGHKTNGVFPGSISGCLSRRVSNVDGCSWHIFSPVH